MSKHLLIYLILLLPSPLIAQSLAQVEQNRAVAQREEIEKLQAVWSRFADALLQRDTAGLKALLSPCIACSNCPANDDSINAVGDRLNSTRLIPFDQFIAIYAPAIFDNRTTSRLKDQSRLHFIDNEVNADLYAAPCILTGTGLKSPLHKEVLLTFIDPSREFEGAQHAFAFIETEEGYKLCGYSTIP